MNTPTLPDFERLLAERWDEIAERAVAKATRTIVWNERIAALNRFLVAAAIVLCVNSAIASVTLEMLLG